MTVDEKVNGNHRERVGPLPGPEPSSDDVRAILGRTITDVASLWDSISAIASLELKRIKLLAIDRIIGGAIAGVLLAAGVAAAVAAALLVVTGTNHALAAWGGADWIGELGAGALLLTVIVVGANVARGRIRRKQLADAIRPRAPKAPAPSPSPSKEHA